MKLTFHGTAANAAAELIVRSPLGRAIDDREGRISLDHNNRYVVDIDDALLPSLSTGERLLWDLLVSMLGGPAPSLYDLADRLDARSADAVVASLASLLGTTSRTRSLTEVR